MHFRIGGKIVERKYRENSVFGKRINDVCDSVAAVEVRLRLQPFPVNGQAHIPVVRVVRP